MKRSTIEARRAAGRLKDDEIAMWIDRGGQLAFATLYAAAPAEIKAWLLAAGADYRWGQP